MMLSGRIRASERASHVVVDWVIMLTRISSHIGALIAKPDILRHVISFIRHLDVMVLGILDRVISDDRYRPGWTTSWCFSSQ